MRLGPNEVKSFLVQIPETAKSTQLEIIWLCDGCSHHHASIQKCKIKDREIFASIACPCCTPLWRRMLNYFQW